MSVARSVQFALRQGKAGEFRKLYSERVLPLLEDADGFQAALALTEEDTAQGITVWRDRDSALRFHTAGYPRVLQVLDPVLVETPRVTTYDVAVNTFQAE